MSNILPAPYLLIRFNPLRRRPGEYGHVTTVEQIVRAHCERQDLREEALNWLHEAVPQVCPELRSDALGISRDVYNDRLRHRDWNALDGLDGADVVARWKHLLEQERSLCVQLESELTVAYEADRQRLQTVLASSDFQLAAPISSLALARSAARYVAMPLAVHTKRLRKVEPKLARYAERAVTKTSPFSHYTIVAFGRWEQSETTLAFEASNRRAVVSPSMLSTLRLVDAALAHPDLLPFVPYRLAVGIQRTATHYELEVLRDEPDYSRLYGTRRVQLRVPRNPAVDWLVRLLAENPSGLTATTMAARLAAAIRGDGADERAPMFVRALVDSGMLVPSISVDQQASAPLRDVAEQIRELEGDRAEALATQLSALEDATSLIGASPAETRSDLLEALESQWSDSFRSWGREAPAGNCCYEDVALADPVPVPAAAWVGVQRMLCSLMDAAEPFNIMHAGQALMVKRFAEHFGVGARCKYAEFAAILPQVFSSDMRSLPAILREIGPSDVDLRTLVDSREVLYSLIHNGRGRDEVSVTDEHLDYLSANTPARFRRDYAAIGAFLQPIAGDAAGIESVVVNAILDGNGQFLSRYTPMWGESETLRVRGHLAKVLPAGATELRPVQGFNPNVHPPLLPREFLLPGRTGSSAQGIEKIDPTDLVVQHDPSRWALQLTNAAGSRVFPMYLGFLIPYLLPWELTGLYLLSHSGQIRIDGANVLERRLGHGEGRVVRDYPRVRYRGLVLTRRRWYVPSELFPFRTPDETLSSYLLRVELWRRVHQVPARVFAARMPLQSGQAGEEESVDGDSFGRPKPFYVDFQSPLHLASIATWCGGAPTIRLEEATPDPGGREGEYRDPLFDGRVTEYLLEFNRMPENSTS